MRLPRAGVSASYQATLALTVRLRGFVTGHPLPEIIHDNKIFAVRGVEDWVGMDAFAEEKLTWLRGGSGPGQRDPNGHARPKIGSG
jgi:hypothetical protein